MSSTTYLNDLIDRAFKQRMSSLMMRMNRQTEALRILQDKRGVRIIDVPRAARGFRDAAGQWADVPLVRGRIEFAGHEWIPASMYEQLEASYKAYVQSARSALGNPESWKSRQFDQIDIRLREYFDGIGVDRSNTTAMLDVALDQLSKLLAEKLESPDLT